MIQFSRDKITPVGGALRTTAARPTAAARTSHAGPKYDQVSISAHADSPFLMEVKSRIAQDVRTATTTGALSTLHDQVQEGEYKIDAGNIARKMLLLGEV